MGKRQLLAMILACVMAASGMTAIAGETDITLNSSLAFIDETEQELLVDAPLDGYYQDNDTLAESDDLTGLLDEEDKPDIKDAPEENNDSSNDGIEAGDADNEKMFADEGDSGEISSEDTGDIGGIVPTVEDGDESMPDSDETVLDAASALDEDLLSAASLPVLQSGTNSITFASNEDKKEYRLTFQTSVEEQKMRYEITSSDSNMMIGYEDNHGGRTRKGPIRISGMAGATFKITFYRSYEGQRSATVTVRKLGKVTLSAVGGNVPDIVAGPSDFEQLALEQLKVHVSYENSSEDDEDIAVDDFDANRDFVNINNGRFFRDVNLTVPTSLENAVGEDVYAKVAWEGENGTTSLYWSFIAVLHVTSADNFPLMVPDNSTGQGIKKLTVTGQWSSMVQIKIDEPGFYQFIGQNAEMMPCTWEGWGGYNCAQSIGVSHSKVDAAGTYWCRVRVREDQNGNLPNSGQVWFRKEADILSVDLEVTDPGNVTWGNWTSKIKKVIRYRNPATGQARTFTASVEDVYPNDNGYYFESVLYTEQIGNSNQYRLIFEDAFRAIYQRLAGRNIHCEKQVTIGNVKIAGDTGTAVGSSAGAVINQSIKDVINGNGAAASDGTKQAIDFIREDERQQIEAQQGQDTAMAVQPTYFSANLEINRANNPMEAQMAQNGAGAGETIEQMMDATIVVRGNSNQLGSITATNGQVEMGLAVMNYDPAKVYSIIRVHNGVAQKLNVSRVENFGSWARIWFYTSEFSTFAVASKKADEPVNITISKVPTNKKPKAGKKGKVTFSWKHFKQTKKTKKIWKKIKRIELEYSTDRSFQTNVMRRSLGKKRTSLTIKLKKNTVYFVRVRYTDGKGGYSNWSKVTKVKTKKK